MIAHNRQPETCADATENVVLVVRNGHMPECGSPPRLATSPNRETYTAYFEDELGDQWLIQIDRRLETGKLYGGDIDWNEPANVPDDVCELILGPEVMTWIDLCWKAATGEWLW
jgi:hypothetical protein